MKHWIALLLLFCTIRPLYCLDVMALHQYDSSLAWSHRFDRVIGETLNRVTRFLRPVNGRITSGFGVRKHPILGMFRHHLGIDIACATGSEVRSVLPGTVLSAGWSKGYGNLIVIRHDGDLSASRYGHLSKILIRSGMKVDAGQLIGLSGQTGLATGPHLHFELYRHNNPIDPEQYFQNQPATASGDHQPWALRD